MLRKVWETADLFAIGGGVYGLMEVMWRGYTHWTMAVLGGLLFLTLGTLDRRLAPRCSFVTRALLGGAVITAAEFAAGYLLNRVLGLAVWDYSGLPFHLMGQICLPYSAAWVAVAACAQALYHSCCRIGWNDVPDTRGRAGDWRDGEEFAVHAAAGRSFRADDIGCGPSGTGESAPLPLRAMRAVRGIAKNLR